jgi:hypothetical protein
MSIIGSTRWQSDLGGLCLWEVWARNAPTYTHAYHPKGLPPADALPSLTQMADPECKAALAMAGTTCSCSSARSVGRLLAGGDARPIGELSQARNDGIDS